MGEIHAKQGKGLGTVLGAALFVFTLFWGAGAVSQKTMNPTAKAENHLETATFAAGCFWCLEAAFAHLEGVKDAVSGYTGGHTDNPTYQEVCTGITGHVEAVRIRYDPRRISYSELLNFYWRQFDPTDDGGSFVDRGSQYRSAVFYHTEEQWRLAEISKRKFDASGVFPKPIVTPILPAAPFHPAEDYHQNYFRKNAGHYRQYRAGSGRDRFLRQVWGTREKSSFSPVPSPDELKQRLTPLQYRVTRQGATESPFRNEYWNNHREGIYVDVVSGEPLFCSKDKFDSGTGWPSFTRPLEPQNIVERIDRNLWMERIEVRSARGRSHLGHVFTDGPPPTGLRYCINSAALRFIPKEDLRRQGYGAYADRFESNQ